jgi:hypothetical protein
MVNVISSFDTRLGTLVGIAFDSADSGNIFTYAENGSTISEFRPNGTLVGTIPFNSVPTDDMDLDFIPSRILGNVSVPFNSLLIFNGDTESRNRNRS